jgi:hypothetical protein
MPSDPEQAAERVRAYLDDFGIPIVSDADLRALLAERDRLKDVLQSLADDDGYCDFVSIAKNALRAPESP